MIPVIKEQIGGYLMDFKDDGIAVKISRLDAHKDGRVTGELTIGAQSKPTVMPKIEWVQEIVEACDKAGVKVFLKDSLRPLLTRDVENLGHWEKQEDDSYRLKLRQEMP